MFLSERHRDALAHLMYGIGQGGSGGFVQLTGEVGTGKTTLCRLVLEQLPDNVRVALVLNPKQTPLELLETICEELHIVAPTRRRSLKTQIDALNHYLLDAYAQDLRVVLIIDEAQELSRELLEQVRLLTNLETTTQKLLQIVLLGQPELRETLARPALAPAGAAHHRALPPDAAADRRKPAPTCAIAWPSPAPAPFPSRTRRCAGCTRCPAACRACSTCSASARCWPATCMAGNASTPRWWTWPPPKCCRPRARDATRLAHPRLVPGARRARARCGWPCWSQGVL